MSASDSQSEARPIDDGGPAFPVPPDQVVDLHHGHFSYAGQGMSLRAYIATKAMAAYIGLSSDGYGDDARQNPSKAAEWAVQHADALIAELKKHQP